MRVRILPGPLELLMIMGRICGYNLVKWFWIREIPMIAIIDVGYEESSALAACVTINDWADTTPITTQSLAISQVAEYVPGEFYKRELPCIQQVLAELESAPEIIVIDGFVWLDENGRKGLGARLFDHLGGNTPVIGVAKTSFATATNALRVYRGATSRPLFVTAAGIDTNVAANAIRRMHGSSRLPTMLTLVDRLSKGSVQPSSGNSRIP